MLRLSVGANHTDYSTRPCCGSVTVLPLNRLKGAYAATRRGLAQPFRRSKSNLVQKAALDGLCAQTGPIRSRLISFDFYSTFLS
jgi:hypothetical protein